MLSCLLCLCLCRCPGYDMHHDTKHSRPTLTTAELRHRPSPKPTPPSRLSHGAHLLALFPLPVSLVADFSWHPVPATDHPWHDPTSSHPAVVRRRIHGGKKASSPRSVGSIACLASHLPSPSSQTKGRCSPPPSVPALSARRLGLCDAPLDPLGSLGMPWDGLGWLGMALAGPTNDADSGPSRVRVMGTRRGLDP
jgi:hypothetical protein